MAQNESSSLCHQITLLARRAVESYIRSGRVIRGTREANDPFLQQSAACFVSIKTMDGDLRGCIGTVEPAYQTLTQEIIHNAIHSATKDPRFSPVHESELSTLRFSIDILSDPEPAIFEDLDAKNYGVIVTDKIGFRRGLLLPDIEGIETADQQVQIAMRKAGIFAEESIKLYRFRVTRFAESKQ